MQIIYKEVNEYNNKYLFCFWIFNFFFSILNYRLAFVKKYTNNENEKKKSLSA